MVALALCNRPAMVTVRAATADDIDDVLDLWARGAGESHIANDVEGVQRLLDRDPEALLLAHDEDGSLVGSVIAGFDGWRAHVYRMAVDPGVRKGGVGRALVDAMEARFRSLGAKRSDAIVYLSNDVGRSFWRACGYEPDPTTDRWTKWL